MPPVKKDFFTSHWGFIASIVATAIGAGNIWRFPRIIALYGGGSFLIPWLVFLLTWSIPLLIAEIGIGIKTRKAPLEALGHIGGSSCRWMGGFVAAVTTCILFYYSVVVGWGISYFCYSITGALMRHHPAVLWNHYSHSPWPIVSHFIAIAIGTWIIYKGIAKGLERFNLILLPLLFVLLMLLALRAFTLPHAQEGLRYLFTFHISDLKNYKLWLEALTQNAWDTGAGWGLILVLSGYAQKKETIVKNGYTVGISNNLISLFMAMIVFASIFGIGAEKELTSLIHKQSNVGFAFVYLPQLFSQFPGNLWTSSCIATIFFLAFVFAAISSMLTMMKVAVQSLAEFGIQEKKSLYLVALIAFLGGIPSAIKQSFFDNQDWVWGLGLIVNGLFITYSITRYGIYNFRKTALHSMSTLQSYWFNLSLRYLIPLQGIVLLTWFIYSSIRYDHWYGLPSLLLQWMIVVIVIHLVLLYTKRKSS